MEQIEFEPMGLLGPSFADPLRGCEAAQRLEDEAYAVQARFLRAYGMKREAFLTDVLGLLQAACSATD